MRGARERLYQGNDLLDPRGVELRLRCKDGSYRWLSGRAAAIVGEDGAAQGVVVGLRDVDDLVQQRERAKEQEHRAHQIMETMVDPHVVLEPLRDPDGAIVDFRYIDANQAACFLTGWTREEFLGRTLLTELPGHRGSTLFDHYCQVIDTGEPLALDGFRFPASIVASERYFDVRVVKSGDALNYTLRDVTRRFRAQLRLQESEHRYRRLAENAADVVYEWELDGTLTWVSPSVTHALGWTPEQVIGHNVREYIHPDDEERSRDPAMFGHAHFEARVLGAAGDWRWMRIARRVVRDTEGRATGLHRDSPRHPGGDDRPDATGPSDRSRPAHRTAQPGLAAERSRTPDAGPDPADVAVGRGGGRPRRRHRRLHPRSHRSCARTRRTAVDSRRAPDVRGTND